MCVNTRAETPMIRQYHWQTRQAPYAEGEKLKFFIRPNDQEEHNQSAKTEMTSLHKIQQNLQKDPCNTSCYALQQLLHPETATRNSELYPACHSAPETELGFFCLFNSELNPSPSEHTSGLLQEPVSLWFANCMVINLLLASDQIFAFQEFSLTNTFDKRKKKITVEV